MNKKVMAMAVAGAFAAAPALGAAQTSTVQIGGAIHLIYVKADSGTINSRDHDNLHTTEPNIYVRGEENLGGGLSAWFQCESEMDVLGITVAGLCGRNSAIGFKGSWGNVFAGTWDQPNKIAYNAVRGWHGLNNVFAGTGPLLMNGAPSNVVNVGAGFHRRQARSINYWSPTWNGFEYKVSFTPTNEQTALAAAASVGKARMWSAAATYRSGPLYLGAGYERHSDFNPAGAALGPGALQYGGGNDTSWTLGASYTFGGVFRLAGAYNRNDYDVNNTQTLENRGWAAYGEWAIQGPHSLKLQYVKQGDSKGTAVGITVGNYVINNAGGTGAKVWGLAYAYAFSKRTTGYLGYNKMDNDGLTRGFSLGRTPAASHTIGMSQDVIGAGLRHSF